MRLGAPALAVFVAPLIALLAAAVLGGAAEMLASGYEPDIEALAWFAGLVVFYGYLPTLLVVALVVLPLSRAFTAAGATGPLAYAIAGALSAVPLILVLPAVGPLLNALAFRGEPVVVFWPVAAIVGCLCAWTGYWRVARPDLAET